jgi:hypothetical protein
MIICEQHHKNNALKYFIYIENEIINP